MSEFFVLTGRGQAEAEKLGQEQGGVVQVPPRGARGAGGQGQRLRACEGQHWWLCHVLARYQASETVERVINHQREQSTSARPGGRLRAVCLK